MDISLAPEDEAFRQEVRAFLDENLPQDMRRDAAKAASVFSEYDLNIRWHKILHKKGWIAPSWPVEYGGTGWTIMQRFIWSSECARANTPNLSPMGLAMVGPCIMHMGTQEQKDFYLPRILSGEDYWCQGYSEPGSGSDLASLQCKAMKDGDHYVINGTKIWTTHAHFANRMFCLVRTDNSGKPQQGITFILLEMDDPGITVEPIITMAGDHEVNQVFFDNVRVPAENVVGEENDGWTVAKLLLEFERGGSGRGAGVLEQLKQLREVAQAEHSGTGQAMIDDPDFAREFAQLTIEAEAMQFNEMRIASALSSGQNPGAISSMMKVTSTELIQRIDTLCVELAAFYGAPHEPKFRLPGSNIEAPGTEFGNVSVAAYLNNRAASIYGGSNQVQRNIMAKLVLGL
ncbi:MAG: acyl-CoA dehydrogenase family protein [Alphaproteobacteria bacterium]